MTCPSWFFHKVHAIFFFSLSSPNYFLLLFGVGQVPFIILEGSNLPMLLSSNLQNNTNFLSQYVVHKCSQFTLIKFDHFELAFRQLKVERDNVNCTWFFNQIFSGFFFNYTVETLEDRLIRMCLSVTSLIRILIVLNWNTCNNDLYPKNVFIFILNLDSNSNLLTQKPP